MMLDVNKKMLTALVASTFPGWPDDFNENYLTYTGNQHNPDWKWNKDRLMELTEHELLFIYRKYEDTE